MRFDIALPNCMEGFLVPSQFAGPAEIIRFAQEAERLGYDALWGFDFTTPTSLMHAPTSEEIRVEAEAFPDPAPPNWYELMISLACVATATRRIKLGTGVIVAPIREPVMLAKQAATLDQFSNGRFLFGLGLGGYRQEFEAIRPRERGAHRGRMLDEILEALYRLLAHEDREVSFEGRYVEFHGVNLNPKPMQDPLPIYLAADTPGPLERAAKWGHGVMVRAAEFASSREVLVPALERHGKDPARYDVAAWADLSTERTRDAAVARFRNSRLGRFRRNLDLDDVVRDHWIGTPEEIIEKLVRQKRQGIDHVILMHTATDTFAEMMEQTQIFAEEILPVVNSA